MVMELVHGVRRADSARSFGSPSRNGGPVPNGGLVPNGGSSDSRDVFHVSFEPEDESIVQVVTNAVALIHNEEPEDLYPLHEEVDVDALRDVVAPSEDDRAGVDEVRFVYEDLEVVVDGDGNLWLQWE